MCVIVVLEKGDRMLMLDIISSLKWIHSLTMLVIQQDRLKQDFICIQKVYGGAGEAFGFC
jgi:hypothetical protein